MRRLLRQAVTVLSALSLLLCMAAAVLWVRSYWREQMLEHTAAGIQRQPFVAFVSARSEAGSIMLLVQSQTWTMATPRPGDLGRGGTRYSSARRDTVPTAETLRRLWLFNAEYHARRVPYPWPPPGSTRRYTTAAMEAVAASVTATQPSVASRLAIMVVPHWFVVVVTAVLPAAWLRAARRRRLAREQLCVKCGYDLRATSERCPECGTPTVKALERVEI